MSIIRTAFVGLCFLIVSNVLPAQVSVASPDGRIVFSLQVGERHELRYSVMFGDEQVISESALGLRFRDQAGFDTGFDVLEAALGGRNERWEQPWGE